MISGSLHRLNQRIRGPGSLLEEGDSITAGFGVQVAERYGTLALSSINGSFNMINVAVSGQTIGQMINSGPTNDNNISDSGHWKLGWTKSRNVAYILGGVNDLGEGQQTGRQIIRRIEQWVAERRRAGWDTIIVGTVVGASGPEFTYINQTLRERPDLYDALADYSGEDPEFLNNGGAYYQDGVHPSVTGHAAMAAIFAAAVNQATGLTE